MNNDFITLLSTVGPKLTKVFKADGTVEAYDDAASFRIKTLPVASLRDVSKVLSSVESKPKHCIIRGKPIDEAKRIKGSVDGTWARQNSNFEDAPHHWLLIDIDGYRPGFADPVHEPVYAIQDFIRDVLPPSFDGAAFHWQLSSSAGTKGKEGVLKAHVWFWSETAYTSAQMYAWAKSIGPAIDKAVFRLVQVHYTAAPIFEEGVQDPVPARSGFYDGFTDSVELVLDASVLSQARSSGSGEGGDDMKLLDPSQKPGLIGAFHRSYDVEHVLAEFCDGQFEMVNERRVSYLAAPSAEGCWIHADRMHIGFTNNTWDGPDLVNLWDLVRIIRFGQLDAEARTGDSFEDMDLDVVGRRPSDIAMLKWAGELPELQEIVKKERAAAVDSWLQKVSDAADQHEIEQVLVPQVQEERELSTTDRERIAVALQARLLHLTGVRLPIVSARRMIRPRSQASASENAPDWAKYWVWVTEQDGFMNIETKQVISVLSYNAKYDRFMARFADENGNVPKASQQALTVWDTKPVDRSIYLPAMDLLFTMDGMRCINNYRQDLAPDTPERISKDDQRAIEIVERHARLLIPDERERRLFLDYLSYCVRRPGAKIRWALLMKGIPGDGKTAFATLMSHVMGHPNVRNLNSNTLEGSDFSGWAVGQCMVAIEEVKLDGHNRYDVYNKLKPYITNDVVEVHSKGRDPYNVPNTSNYLLLTNYDDALPIDENDRRIFYVRSPFASKEQLFARIKSDTGLDPGDYFDELFDMAIKPHAGALRRWLLERELSPEFKADGRAPVTSHREMLVDMSKAEDELAVMQELEVGGKGVYAGLVSVTHLVPMVKDRHGGLELRTRRVSTILANLGWTPFNRIKWHGENCRIYYRADVYKGPLSNHDMVLELDRLELSRSDSVLDEDFKD